MVWTCGTLRWFWLDQTLNLDRLVIDGVRQRECHRSHGGMELERLWKDLDCSDRMHRTGTHGEGEWSGKWLKHGFHSNARNASACIAWKIESILSLHFPVQWQLASVAWLVLAYFCFCLHNFIAFVAFLLHFLFCLHTFSYARPCVHCVRLNGNRA